MRLMLSLTLLLPAAAMRPPPRDSELLREAIDLGKPRLFCNSSMVSLASVASSLCSREEVELDEMEPADGHEEGPVERFVRNLQTSKSRALLLSPAARPREERCYLLSQTPLQGSQRSLDCLGLLATAGVPNLPSFPAWGFLHPSCWSYVRVKRQPLAGLTHPSQSVTLTADARVHQLAKEASQEWQHPAEPRTRKKLRVVVRGRCLPFLLDDYPHKLAQGRLRKDTLATTVTRLRSGRSKGGVEEVRRVAVVDRVSIDHSDATTSSFKRARERHFRALNPVVMLPEQSNWLLPDSPMTALLRERSDLFERQRVRWRRGSAMLLVNAVAIAINIVVAWRATALWNIVEKNRVSKRAPVRHHRMCRRRRTALIAASRLPSSSLAVDWIQRAAPHAETTIVTVRWVDKATKPFRTVTYVLGRLTLRATHLVGSGITEGVRRVASVGRDTW